MEKFFIFAKVSLQGKFIILNLKETVYWNGLISGSPFYVTKLTYPFY